MRLIQLIAIAVVFWLLFRMIRHWLHGNRNTSQRATDAPPHIDSVVKCAHCGLHIPEKEAIKEEERFFCSEEHRQRYHD